MEFSYSKLFNDTSAISMTWRMIINHVSFTQNSNSLIWPSIQGLTFHITPGVPQVTCLPRKFLCELVAAGGGIVQSAAEKRWSARRVLESQRTSSVRMIIYTRQICLFLSYLHFTIIHVIIELFFLFHYSYSKVSMRNYPWETSFNLIITNNNDSAIITFCP